MTSRPAIRQRSIWLAGVCLLVVAGALGYGGWRMFETQRFSACAACARPLDSHSETVAALDGERKRYCCPACALSDARQSGSKVEIVSLSDQAGDDPLDPAEAFVVVGSSVNHCLRTEPRADRQRHLSHLEFDRCSPSILAFRDEASARRFAETQGGTVVPATQIAAVTQF